MTVNLNMFLPLFFASIPAQFDYQDPEQIVVPSMGSLLLRIIISLAVVVGLAILLIKIFQKSRSYSGSGRWIRILDQVVIGSNRALMLVEIAGKIYVIGVTDHNISKLLEIEDISQIDFLATDELETKLQFSNVGTGWFPTMTKNFKQIFLNRKESGRGYGSSREED
jgi:flagellar protein FliO/FliZ